MSFVYQKVVPILNYCTKTGTYKRNYLGSSNMEITVTCCDTNLCNVESSAKILYGINSSYLSI